MTRCEHEFMPYYTFYSHGTNGITGTSVMKVICKKCLGVKDVSSPDEITEASRQLRAD
jgi:hypothetical protein